MIYYWALLFYFFNSSVNSASVEYVQRYSGYKEYRVTGDKTDIDQFEAIVKELDEPFIYKRTSFSSFSTIVSPEMLNFFEVTARKQKLLTKLTIEDISEIIRQETSPKSKTFSWTDYYDIDGIYGYLKNMSIAYPQWTQLVVGGESYQGRQIKGLRINTPEGKTNKPAIFLESGIHAREWITPATTTYFINQLLTSNNSDIVALRNQFDWHIFPSVNPDGYHYTHTTDRMWRKTRSKPSGNNFCYGADPNRNWDYNWQSSSQCFDVCDEMYAGSEPFSEIETRTLSSYISKVENLTGYIAFHSCVQVVLVPHSDSVEHQGNYDDLIKIGKKSIEYGYKVNGALYDGPKTWAEFLEPVSGVSIDWVRSTLGTPLVFVYELRGDSFMWPKELIYQQGDEVTQMMLGFIEGSRELGYFK